MNKLLALATIGIATCAQTLHAQDEPDRRPGFTDERMQVVDNANRQVPLIPAPAETYWGRGDLAAGTAEACHCSVVLEDGASAASELPGDFTKRMVRRFGHPPAAGPGGLRFVFSLRPASQPQGAELASTLKAIDPEGYVLETVQTANGPEVLIVGNSVPALWHGMVTAVGLLERKGARITFPRVKIVDYPRMRDRAVLVDVGGQGFMVGPSRWDLARWKEFVDWMVDCKLNGCWLEFIGSGRLMGNLDMQAGQWVGFPLELRSYPKLVGKDRPIRRWDAGQHRVVDDTYTIPNVTHDFVRELIDYAQARGIRCDLAIGWDYFANQLPVTLGIPANDPEDPRSDRFYDTVLQEIVRRYDNASGVVLITIENKGVPPTMLAAVIRRANDAERMIRAINPKMRIALLPDYLEWRPQEEIETLRRGLPAEMALAYSPHREPQQKAWKRIYGDVWRYQLYSQYAWDHIAYIFPAQIQQETWGSYCDGYRRVVTQAWYFDVFALNYLAMADFSWNPTGDSVEQFWNKALDQEFGRPARELMRTALEHTRFDVRFDIIGRMITRPTIQSPFSFWDMYHLTRYSRLDDGMLAALESDARTSLDAAQAALPLVPATARESVEMTIISAQRRLYLATSARHLVKALALKQAGDRAGAKAQMDLCLQEGAKLLAAAEQLGIEYPMAVHDEKIVARYREIRAGL